MVTERSDGCVTEQGRPARKSERRKPLRAGVRARMVAKKPVKAGGATASRKVDA